MKFLGPTSSGSQADQVFSHNRYGQYVRRRATPTQPRSGLQLAVRGQLSEQSARWSLLSDAQRAAWTAWAQAHPITDRLGQTQTLTGHAFFVRVNVFLLQWGELAVSVPPTTEPSWVSLVSTLSLTATGDVIQWTYSPSPSVGYFYFLEATCQVNPGIGFAQRYALISKAGPSDPSPFDSASGYHTACPALLVGGRKVFYRVGQAQVAGAFLRTAGTWTIVAA